MGDVVRLVDFLALRTARAQSDTSAERLAPLPGSGATLDRLPVLACCPSCFMSAGMHAMFCPLVGSP